MGMGFRDPRVEALAFVSEFKRVLPTCYTLLLVRALCVRSHDWYPYLGAHINA